MHFYLPRRHRRRLLLPPGLVALAGLLLLGCLALRPWQERLTRHSVLQLTMPVRPKLNHSFYTVLWVVPNPDTLRKHYSWYEAVLSGKSEQDVSQQQQIILALHNIAADTLHGGILQVQLGPKARYANIVFLLDLMLREKVTHYWLDITRYPAAFYALQTAYVSHVPMFVCGTGDNLTRFQISKQLPFEVRFDNWVTDFWRFERFRQLWQVKLEQLRQPEWRGPLVLLALLFLLSFRRLLAGIRVARTL